MGHQGAQDNTMKRCVDAVSFAQTANGAMQPIDLQPFAGQDWDTQIDDLVNALSHLRFNGHEVLLFHLLDHAEIELPFEGSIRFVDPETGEELVTVPERVRSSYLEQMGEYLADIEQTCAQYDVEYTRLDTERPLDYALTSYLATRQKLL